MKTNKIMIANKILLKTNLESIKNSKFDKDWVEVHKKRI